MKKTFEDLLAIAKRNVEENPSIVGADTKHVSKRYLDSLVDEVKEVCDELVPDNAVFLEDELSDIAWNYAVLLNICAERGLIDSVQSVLQQANKKYTKRKPAFLKASKDLWNVIKASQKEELRKKHKNKYT